MYKRSCTISVALAGKLVDVDHLLYPDLTIFDVVGDCGKCNLLRNDLRAREANMRKLHSLATLIRT